MSKSFACTVLACCLPHVVSAQEARPSTSTDAGKGIRFINEAGALGILIDGVRVATYHHAHAKTTRPFFADVFSLSARPVKVSRNFPPVEGVDADDHAAMHPGIWLAFGDIGGADVWRLKARVEHVEFVERREGEARASFTVRNRYVDGDRVVCEETCTHAIVRHAGGYLITYDSKFTSDRADFAFGDQEEMGLGIRVATAITVKGGGSMLDSEGRKDERGTWGQPADWLDYRGVIDGREVGMTLMGHPENFRRAWFHSRDYGAAVLNPFGRKAMHQGPESKVAVRRGETLHFRCGVFVHDALGGAPVDPAKAYRAFVGAFE